MRFGSYAALGMITDLYESLEVEANRLAWRTVPRSYHAIRTQQLNYFRGHCTFWDSCGQYSLCCDCRPISMSCRGWDKNAVFINQPAAVSLHFNRPGTEEVPYTYQHAGHSTWLLTESSSYRSVSEQTYHFIYLTSQLHLFIRLLDGFFVFLQCQMLHSAWWRSVSGIACDHPRHSQHADRRTVCGIILPAWAQPEKPHDLLDLSPFAQHHWTS